MKINNDDYGGFVVSKNVLNGISVKYSFRQKSSIKELNGWNLYSEEDDEEYINDAKNFIIINAESICKVAPIILEIFHAPYGTDLAWLYIENVHVGFYDLVNDCETAIEKILK
jgi:hypothetical protein